MKEKLIRPEEATAARCLTPEGFEAPGGISHVSIIQCGIAPLAVGPAQCAGDMAQLGWSVIICCYEAACNVPGRVCLNIGMQDGAPFPAASRALSLARDFWRSELAVYVCCLGGRSRSTSLCAAMLTGREGAIGFDKRMDYIKSIHPSTGPMPEPQGSLRRAVAEVLR